MNEEVVDDQGSIPGKEEVIFDEMTVPLKNPEVTTRDEVEEDGKYMLFNAENELILVINSTGKFILDHCDGKRNVTGLVEEIKKKFTIKDDMDLTQVVKDYIAILYKASLVKIGKEK